MISGQQIDDFSRDGAIAVRHALDEAWIELLRDGVEQNMASPGPMSTDYTPDGRPGRFWGDYCNWQRIDEYRRVLLESPLAEMARRAMRSESARLFHEHVLVKEAGTVETTPWHHDQPYYCLAGDQLLSIWVPLDPVPIEASPRFVAGSHRGPMYLPRRFADHVAYDYDDIFEPVPDIDATVPPDELLSWALEPGDCIIFHMRTLHDAAGSPTRRRAFCARWLGDDVRYATRPTTTSPPYEELVGVLAPGDPMDHPLFPVVASAPPA